MGQTKQKNNQSHSGAQISGCQNTYQVPGSLTPQDLEIWKKNLIWKNQIYSSLIYTELLNLIYFYLICLHPLLINKICGSVSLTLL